MVDRGLRDIRPRNARGVLREQRAAVALAARDVEDLAAGDERGREMVAVPVLVPDLAGGARDEALAGEFEFVVYRAPLALRGVPPDGSPSRASGCPGFYPRGARRAPEPPCRWPAMRPSG